MDRVTGGSLPARIWRAFMIEALEGRPVVPLETEPESQSEPDGAAMAAIAGAPLAEDGGLDEASRGELEALLTRLDGL
jgi:hypothetical protein